MIEYKDVLGQEIKVGNRIAYARQGRGSDHGSLVIGKVISLGVKKAHYSWEKDGPSAQIEWEELPTYNWMNNGSGGTKSTVTKFENMVKINPRPYYGNYPIDDGP